MILTSYLPTKSFDFVSEDPVERQILTQLANRLVLVINGATGEKYLIKTLDYIL